jgi:hypothetical protein
VKLTRRGEGSALPFRLAAVLGSQQITHGPVLPTPPLFPCVSVCATGACRLAAGSRPGGGGPADKGPAHHRTAGRPRVSDRRARKGLGCAQDRETRLEINLGAAFMGPPDDRCSRNRNGRPVAARLTASLVPTLLHPLNRIASQPGKAPLIPPAALAPIARILSRGRING